MILLTPPLSSLSSFVRARILLEDENTGCVASFGDSLCVILCRFSRAEHQLVLPLWRPNEVPTKTFEHLIEWHAQSFTGGARLSGAALEWPDDKRAWMEVIRE